MARTATFRRRLAALAIAVTAAIGGLAGSSPTEAEAYPIYCGHTRSHVVFTQPLVVGWYCDSPSHPNCDGFPFAGVTAWLVETFHCVNV